VAEKGKPKRHMGLGVSTQVENAWYVDPELLAGGEPPLGAAPGDDDLPPPDTTVHLGDAELEEAAGALGDADVDARHYRDVSLRGAVLARDEETPPPEPSLGERLRELGARRTGETPPPPPKARRRPGPGLGVVSEILGTLAREIAGLFEPGRVPPAALAAVCFLLGVALTVVGVLLAL
jgi:hypothetical protein